MVITAILTGGAVAPYIPPSAIIAAAFSAGIPIAMRIGQTIAPALITAAVEDPVIIPGNMIISIRSRSRMTLWLWNLRRKNPVSYTHLDVYKRQV